MSVYVCLCVRACVRACMRVCVVAIDRRAGFHVPSRECVHVGLDRAVRLHRNSPGI